MHEFPSDDEVRQSFARQVALFSGTDSLFAGRHSTHRSSSGWVEPLDEQMIVLDVACGAAHVAEELAPRVRQVVGLDLTPDLLRLGADRLREAGVGNVLLQEGNAADLPFVDRSFDLVLCRSALHHFRRPTDMVREMARVCRPGGRVVVSDMVAPNAEVKQAFDDVHRHLDPSHMGVLLGEEVVALLAHEVGPVSWADLSEPFPLPLDHIFSDASDRPWVRAALAAEVEGGPLSGFAPRVDPETGALTVSFSSVIVHATRP